MAETQKIERINLENLSNLKNAREKIISPEKKIENISSSGEKKSELKPAPEIININSPVKTPVAITYQQKRIQEIDSILSDGLNEVFLKMKPAEQKIFKKKGEETVLKINELLNETRIKINKIISLIRKWLSLVVGINKFFLEQEVKIKADRIMRLKDK